MATKKFNNMKDAIRYAQHVLDSAKPTFIGAVADQIYKDSDEFTYRDTGDMYKSGDLYSQFNKGIIIERSPYVRRRYYQGGKAGAGNPNAQPRWFEKTVAKHKEEYKSKFGIAIEKAKKEV